LSRSHLGCELDVTADAQSVALETLDERYSELRLQRPELLAAVRRSIERDGLLHPLLVNQARDGTLAVLDGFKRLRALRELGESEVAVRIVHLDEAAARAAMLTHNVAHSGLCEIEEAWIVCSLVRTCKLPQKAVAALVGRHKSWVCRRLHLAECLDRHVQDDMRLGLCSATVAREVVRLPRGNQARVAEVVRRHGLTTRQCAALVDRCLSCDKSSTLDLVLDDPLRFLVTGPESHDAPRRRDPRLTPRGETVRRRIVELEQRALELCQILRQHPPSTLANEELGVLSAVAKSACERSREAATALTELLGAAEGAP
jgi:ParB/RepB/Spo0J family partition protein